MLKEVRLLMSEALTSFASTNGRCCDGRLCLGSLYAESDGDSSGEEEEIERRSREGNPRCLKISYFIKY